MFKESIGNGRYLSATINGDELMVHIREFETKNDKTYPTRRGAYFTKARWSTFVSHLDEISRNVELLKAKHSVDYKQHVGGAYYVSISKDFPCVNIRRFFRPSNSIEERPSRSGIALRLDKWPSLLTAITNLHKRIPQLKSARPCYLEHENQLSFYVCAICNPFEHHQH